MVALELRGVSKHYGKVLALDDIDLQVHHGETVALIGPSGCGKSTLLSVITGLEPHRGKLLWRGHDIAATPTSARGFGVVFQDYALFPHLNVFENIAFGLRIRREPQAQVCERVSEVLRLVGLTDFGRRDVMTLSGGERQRVALARALAPKPRLLILDEPLAALDRNLRDRLSEDLATILSELYLPAIYITHDVEEALSVADRVAIMQPRRIAQIGAPQEIYRTPANEYVARFLGLDNLIDARWEQHDGHLFLHTALGMLPAEALPQSGEHGQEMKLLLRPNGAIFTTKSAKENDTAATNNKWDLRGEVHSRSFRGAAQRLEITVAGIKLRFRVPAEQTLPSPGSVVTASIDPRQGACLIPVDVVGQTPSAP